MTAALEHDPFPDEDEALLLSGATTLVAGTTFCVVEPTGDIEPDRSQGLFVDDTRVLSRWRLRVDGAPVEPLSGDPTEPYEATYVGRAAPRPGHADATVVVERRRELSATGLREDVTIRNYAAEAAGLQLVLEADADFADLFEVKEGRSPQRTDVGRRAVGHDLLLWLERAGTRRGVRVTAPDGTASREGLTFRALVPAQGSWTATVEVRASRAGHDPDQAEVTDRRAAAARMRTWRAGFPRITCEHDALRAALWRSRRDLGALRIVDRQHPADDVVAAGAPWFMALFGRDSLLTSSMALPFAPALAMGTLRTLARLQGTRDDPMTDEQPGRILHEVRLGMDVSLALGGGAVYYGSIDATPLFVVLTDLALRWGVPRSEVVDLMPAVDAAMTWLLERGDRDGDGFLEYERGTDRGLLHQGWKDSHDGILFADGTPARTPIATAEVQGYAYAAFRARAHLADVLGDPVGARSWHARAAALQRAFDDRFWLPERGWYALALDRDKRPVDALASNMGHCLWSGIVPAGRVAPVADALVG
jgi:glycogen debranching enzyme